MCIFQLPAITRLRTPQTSAELRANLRCCRCAVLNDRVLSRERDPISWIQLTTTTGLDLAIDRDGSSLNLLFGFATGRHPSHPFEELVELHRSGAAGSH